jgi:hypothetical protein
MAVRIVAVQAVVVPRESKAEDGLRLGILRSPKPQTPSPLPPKMRQRNSAYGLIVRRDRGRVSVLNDFPRSAPGLGRSKVEGQHRLYLLPAMFLP